MKSSIKAIVLLCLLTTMSGFWCKAQVLPFHYYTASNGLLSNNITRLYQDTHGLLWIGTQLGLSVYDSREFINFQHADGVPLDWIMVIVEDRYEKGAVWIGDAKGNLFKGYGRELRYIASLPHQRSEFFNGIFQDTTGRLFCSTNGARMYVFENGKFNSSIESGFNVWKPHITIGDSVVYFIGLQGFAYYSYRDLKLHFIQKNENGEALCALTLLQDGTILASLSDTTLIRIRGTTIIERRKSPLGAIESIIEDKEGNLWLSRSFDIVKVKKEKLFTGPYTFFNEQNGVQGNTIPDIIFDAEENFWIADEKKGLARLSVKTLSSVPFSMFTPGEHVNIMMLDSNDRLWSFTRETLNETWKDTHNVWHTVSHKDLPERATRSPFLLSQDSRNRLWLEQRNGTVFGFEKTYERDKATRLRLMATLPPLSNEEQPIPCFLIDSKERAWSFVGKIGLLVYDWKAPAIPLRTFRTGEGIFLHDRYLITAMEDSKGNIWGGLSRYGLLKFHADSVFTAFPRVYSLDEGMPDHRIRTLKEDHKGRIWVGTLRGGIAILEGDRIEVLGVTDGLPGNHVTSFAEDLNGRMWIATTNGIAYYEADKGKTLTLIPEFYGKIFLWCGITSKNTLLAATLTELFEYDYMNEKFPAVAPPVYLSGVKVNGQPMTKNGMGEFSYDKNSWSFDFRGIDFRHEGNVTYQYRLKGIHDNWQQPTSQSNVTFAELQPGAYTFEVKAINVNGLESPVAASMSFLILPPFWQRWWFYGILALSSTTAIITFVRSRVRKLKQETERQREFSQRLIESQEAERKRIAAELHDGLGQNLLLIYNQLVLGKNAVGAQPEIVKQLEEISLTTSLAIEEVREVTYNLRPFILDRLGLSQALVSLVERFDKSTTIKFTHEIDSINGLFSKEDEMNVFRIVQEGMNNVIKHSRATEAQVIVLKNESYVTITVEDNGKGFDVPMELAPKKHSGFGMQGMAERVKMLKGTYEVRSTIGKGTTIIITIPIKVERHE